LADDAPGKIDPTDVARQYEELSEPLRQFLRTLLRDPAAVQDVMQTVFAKLLERGSDVREPTARGWLFRVAYNEAMLILRRGRVHTHALRQLGNPSRFHKAKTPPQACPDALIREETLQAVRRAVDSLPEAQREVLIMRIYENKTFAQIAEQLGVPLGTVLTRMRSALEKLRRQLNPERNPEGKE
jgi:RNA polymerase sigma-70 factor (ECF subfamily)